MSVYLILFPFIFSLILTFLVVRKTRLTGTHYLFLCGVAGIGLWSISVFLAYWDPWIYYARMAFFSSLLIVFGNVGLYVVYPSVLTSRYRTVLWGMALVLSALGGITLFTDQIVTTMYGPRALIYGPWYRFYFVLALASALAIVWLMMRQYAVGSHDQRARLLYVVMGGAASVSLTFIFNVLLPSVRQPHFNHLGPLSTLFYLAATAYSMQRYRLLDIEIVIKRSMMYLLSFVSTSLFFYAAIYWMGTYIVSVFFLPEWLLIVFFGSMVVMLRPFFRWFFDKSTDIVFFKSPYRLSKLSERYSIRLKSNLDRDDVLDLLRKTLLQDMKIEHVGFYLFSPDGYRLEPGFDGAVDVVDASSPLAELFKMHKMESVYVRPVGTPTFEHSAEYIEVLREHMDAFADHLIVPLYDDGGVLEGLVCFGPKKSDEPYSNQDVLFLENLVLQIGVVLKNATQYAVLKESVQLLDQRRELMFQLNTCLDLSTLFEVVAHYFKQVYQVNSIALYILDGDALRLIGVSHPEWAAAGVSGLVETLTTAVGKVWIDSDYDALPEALWFIRDELNRHAFRDSFITTLVKMGSLVGVMCGGSTDRYNRHNRLRHASLETLSYQVSLAVGNVMLYQSLMVLRDYQRLLMTELVSGIILIDSNLTIHLINRAAERILRVKPGSLIEKPFTELFRFSRDFIGIETCLQSGEESHVSITAAVQNRSLCLSVYFSPYVIGAQSGVVCMMTDITAEREYQDQIEKFNQLANIGNMAAGISVEITEPLVSIEMMTDLLLKYWNSGDFQERFENIVGPQILKIDSLCKALLRFGAPSRPNILEHELNEIIRDVVVLTGGEQKRFGAQVNLELEDDLILKGVRGDFSQVFLHLIMNGIQSIPSDMGGIVDVQSRRLISGEVEVLISDTGVGLEAELLDELSTGFFGFNSGGLGVGLSIVQRILTDYDVTLSISSHPDAGTVLTIIFPPSVVYSKKELV